MIADLPESLLISQSYLPSIVKTSTLFRYQDQRGQLAINDDKVQGSISFIGSHDVPRIDENIMDVIVNIASFQEMKKYFLCKD